jgi:hypothetical protein
MKRLGWLFFLTTFNLSAQSIINNPPLSIDPETGNRMSTEDTPVGTLVPAKIDEVDGHLIIGEKKPEQAAVVEKQSVTVKEVKEVKDVKEEATYSQTPVRTYFSLEKYIQFSFGYLNSNWKKIDPVLSNGSGLIEFRMVSDVSHYNQFGFAVEMIQDRSKVSVPDNIRALQYKIFMDHHYPFFVDKLDGLFGLAVSLGDYSIRKSELNGSGESVSTKIKSGTLYGIIPSAGFRYYLGGLNSIDVALEYHCYFSKPQRHINGLALAPRFSFVF